MLADTARHGRGSGDRESHGEGEDDYDETFGRIKTMTFPDNNYRDGLLGSGYDTHSAANYDRLAATLKS